MPTRDTLEQSFKFIKYRASIPTLVQFAYPKGGELEARWIRLTCYVHPHKTDRVMVTFLKIFIVVLLALAFIGWLADRPAATKPDVTPRLSFLPDDIKYENPNGNVESISLS